MAVILLSSAFASASASASFRSLYFSLHFSGFIIAIFVGLVNLFDFTDPVNLINHVSFYCPADYVSHIPSAASGPSYFSAFTRLMLC